MKYSLPSAQMSESVRLNALLTIAGGFFDTYTYLCRGGVFANAQTGNVVLLGVALAQRDWTQGLHYLIPILAFAFGVIASNGIRQWHETHPIRFHWRQTILLLEIFLVVWVAFLSEPYNALANVLVSFICALQMDSFRKVRGSAFTTTVCTGNLRSATEQLVRWYRTKDVEYLHKASRYGNIVLYFLIGAILGVFAVSQFAERGILFCCLPLFLAFAMMFAEKT